MIGARGPARAASRAIGRGGYRRAPTGTSYPHDGSLRRRLPPYMRRHAGRLEADSSVTVWVTIGSDAWRWAAVRVRSHHIVIVCPPGDDPAEYDWTACGGHDPVLLVRAGPTDGEQVRALIEAVIRDGTDRVLDDQGALYVVREVAHAA